MAKQVTTKSSVVFRTLKAAREHFSELRESIPVGEWLGEPDRSDVLDIYKRYCEATGYPVEDAVNVTTQLDNQPRPQGIYARTKAFAVVNVSGSTSIFSMDKALKEIAI